MLCLIMASHALAEESEDFLEMSLEELLNVKIKVASKKGGNIREIPGIVTLITEEEIKNSGARDLIDVLRLVPGFHFGVDVQGVVGIGVRGNWAHEGKVLMLIDGHEFNENLYSTLQFGNHIPVDQIKKIEIIRGPGSALYGGYAELAVINVITKKAEDINGVSISAMYGQMEDTYGSRNVSISFGKVFNDVSVTAKGFLGEGNRSDQDYTDFYEQTYNMKDNSDLHPMNLNLGLKYKGLTARFMMDRYHMTSRDAFDWALIEAEGYDESPDVDFNSYFLNITYDYQLGEKILITPEFSYKYQQPWYNDDFSLHDEYMFLDKSNQRTTAKLSVSYDFTESDNLLLGGEFYTDKANAGPDHPVGDYFENGEDEITYQNLALWSQLAIKDPLIRSNITVGARYDDNEGYGESFVPRFALTKVLDKFHFKGLVSQAFRAPAIENMRTNRAAIKKGAISKELDPEKTTVFELEAGYQLTDRTFVTANMFNININDPIVYVWDSEYGIEYYLNFDETETRGIELEYRLKDKWGYVTLNYSYYQVAENTVADYAVEDNEDLFLGFPAHKVSLNSNILLNGISVNPSVTYMSKRYGYAPHEYDEPMLKEFDPTLLANIYFRYQNVLTEGLDVGVGVYDILGENYEFIQPYNGWHAPLPGPSREVVFRIEYAFGM